MPSADCRASRQARDHGEGFRHTSPPSSQAVVPVASSSSQRLHPPLVVHGLPRLSLFNRASKSKDRRGYPVDLVRRLRLARLDVPGRVLLDHNVGEHPIEDRISVMFEQTIHDELLELLRRRPDGEVPHPNELDIKAVALEIRSKARRVPRINCDLTYPVLIA